MKRLFCVGMMALAAALPGAFSIPAHAQLFDTSYQSQIEIDTSGAVFIGTSPAESTDFVNFTTGTAGAQGVAGSHLVLTMSVVNAANFATTGAQWLTFTYVTQGFVPIGVAPGLEPGVLDPANWSITETGIPILQSAAMIGDITQWFNDQGQPRRSLRSLANRCCETIPSPVGLAAARAT